MKTTDIVSCNVNHKIINESNIVPVFHKTAFFFSYQKAQKTTDRMISTGKF